MKKQRPKRQLLLEEMKLLKYLYENNVEMKQIGNYLQKHPISILRIVQKNGFKRKNIQEVLEDYEENKFK